MRHSKKPAIVVSATFFGSPAAANMQAALFVPELQVNPISADEFEVIEGRSQGARTYWCAAAYHAQYTLGRTSGRLYLSRSFGPARTVSGVRSVSFSLTETATTQGLVSLTIRQVGANLLIGHAIQFCRDSDLEADQ